MSSHPPRYHHHPKKSSEIATPHKKPSPRDQIEVYKVSEVSMMPEQLEKQITPQELADLFSYLALDKPPSDPKAKYLPGYPRGK